jgi:branched-chain amino acid transport system ATP-binding protein
MSELLAFDGVTAGYGNAVVLHRLGFSLRAGESLAILGRNGVGKTTTLETLMGNTRVTGGAIRWRGQDITRLPAHQRVRAGLGWVPQEREVFPSLTVEENLTVVARPGAWNIQRVYGLFPRLRERAENMGNQLSGGEQQMLAVGRALMTNPRLLILDEATEGLAPLIRAEIWRCLAALKAAGQSILVIDKNVDALTRFADRHTIIEKGRVVWTGTSAELRADENLQHRYLGV